MHPPVRGLRGTAQRAREPRMACAREPREARSGNGVPRAAAAGQRAAGEAKIGGGGRSVCPARLAWHAARLPRGILTRILDPVKRPLTRLPAAAARDDHVAAARGSKRKAVRGVRLRAARRELWILNVRFPP